MKTPLKSRLALDVNSSLINWPSKVLIHPFFFYLTNKHTNKNVRNFNGPFSKTIICLILHTFALTDYLQVNNCIFLSE